jgi:deoxycytidine triphosphate deaminase
MAKILADSDIKKLLGTVILNGDEKRINPNGIEIRLGKNVLFQSTDEEKELGPGTYLKVLPGESVTISSYEDFSFTRETVQKVFPGCDLMVLVTPTTTMMREGIVHAATKIDSGWHGTLNWGLRNSSIKDFILGYGEPIFKLTFFLLQEGEIPQIPYGQRDNDQYQDSKGIVRSTRKIPANIPQKNIIGSSVDRLDPVKQLREAGHPFNYIGTELTALHGQFELVSTDVRLLKDTIGSETEKLSGKIESSQKTVLEKVEGLFDRKFMGAIGRIIAAGSVMYGAAGFLQSQGLNKNAVSGVAVFVGVFLWLFVHFFCNRQKP